MLTISKKPILFRKKIINYKSLSKYISTSEKYVHSYIFVLPLCIGNSISKILLVLALQLGSDDPYYKQLHYPAQSPQLADLMWCYPNYTS